VVPAIDSAALARDEPVRDWSCARLAFSPRPMGGRDCRKRRALSGQLDGVVVGSVLPGRAYGPHPRALHASNAQRAGRSIVSGAATLATSGVPALLSSPPSLGAGRQLSSQSNGQPNSNLITTDMSARQRRRSLLVRAVAPPNRPLLTPGSGSRGRRAGRRRPLLWRHRRTSPDTSGRATRRCDSNTAGAESCERAASVNSPTDSSRPTAVTRAKELDNGPPRC
jgi:hypothetical protein